MPLLLLLMAAATPTCATQSVEPCGRQTMLSQPSYEPSCDEFSTASGTMPPPRPFRAALKAWRMERPRLFQRNPIFPRSFPRPMPSRYES